MQIKFLKQIVENVAGDSADKIVDLLSKKKDVNEFIIAKKLDLTINQTRNLLYRLAHLGILTSTRKKDKRKGWYIYFWTLNALKSLEILESRLKEEITQLENQLVSRRTKRFYKCKICGVEVGEESALLTNFICPECGEVYGLSDNKQYIGSLEKEISKLKKELDLVVTEREKEEGKQEKKLARVIRKVEAEKKAKRAAAAKKRKAAMKRAKKAAEKEQVKKKSKKPPKKAATKKVKKKPKKPPKKKDVKKSKTKRR